VSVSRAKLIIPVRSADTLSRLAPDYEALWRCCELPLRAGFPEEAIAECADGQVRRTAIRGTARIVGREHIAF
jgi:hypothetical protein